VPGQSEQQRGAALFAANCASCHGSRGQGIQPGRGAHGGTNIDGAGPSLKHVGALAADFYLTTGYMPVDKPTAQPVRQRQPLYRDEIAALTRYVASLGSGPPVPPAGPGTGSVARGLEHFTTHCAGCHQMVAEGGIVTGARVPPLDKATPRQIREAVRIGPYVMPRFSKKAISDRELEDIVAYVQYAQNPHDAGGWSINHLGPFPEGLAAWFIAIGVLLVTCIVIGTRVRKG
jgi:ubiquinol-cytochrome c reductase cytochrome c subunit